MLCYMIKMSQRHHLRADTAETKGHRQADAAAHSICCDVHHQSTTTLWTSHLQVSPDGDQNRKLAEGGQLLRGQVSRHLQLTAAEVSSFVQQCNAVNAYPTGQQHSLQCSCSQKAILSNNLIIPSQLGSIWPDDSRL